MNIALLHPLPFLVRKRVVHRLPRTALVPHSPDLAAGRAVSVGHPVHGEIRRSVGMDTNAPGFSKRILVGAEKCEAGD